jgi:hypothetical protein
MKPLLALFALGLLSTCAVGCGGGSGIADSSPAAATTARVTTLAPGSPVFATPRHVPSEAATRRYLGYPKLAASVLLENARILAKFYGQAASEAASRTITALVKRYYAVAKTGDGKQACSMMIPSIVKAIPVDYGEFGASYLHGAKTCPTVLSRMFEHSHGELTAPITVTGVLVKGDRAYALLDSARIHASTIALLREHGAWMVAAPLGSRIPIAK